MTDPASTEGRRSWLSPRLAPPVIGVGLYSLMLLGGSRLLNDADSYWHLVVGGWILAHRAWPTADPFSFTMPGAHWIAKEWLSQVIYTGAFAAGGWAAVAMVAAAAIALALALLTALLLDELAPLPAVALMAAAFLLLAPHALARPHALALPVMVAFVGGLFRAVDRGRPPPFRLLPLVTLWANLHAGFALGLVLAVAAAIAAAAASPATERARTAAGWTAFAAGALLAACITPYGWEPIAVTLRVLGLGPALSLIGEWRPPDFSRLGGFELLLLLGVGLAIRFRLALPAARILILLGLLHLGLSAERNGEIVGLLAPLVLARPLAAQYPRLAAAAGGGGSGRPIPFLPLAAAIAIAIPASLAIAATGAIAPSPRISPAAAVAALRQAGAGRVLNDYDLGGYLVFAGVPTFIDGRTELYGSDFVLRHQRAVTLADLPGLLGLLDAYRIDATLLAPATPAVAFLDRLPGWRRIYGDDIAVVHVRQSMGRVAEPAAK